MYSIIMGGRISYCEKCKQKITRSRYECIMCKKVWCKKVFCNGGGFKRAKGGIVCNSCNKKIKN